MKNTIEDPLCMNYNSAGVLMSNKDIPKELRSVSLVDLSVAIEFQDELNKCNHTLTEQGKMYNELRQEKESIQHHRDELHDDNEAYKSLLKESEAHESAFKSERDQLKVIGQNALTELAEQKKLIHELMEAINNATYLLDAQSYELDSHEFLAWKELNNASHKYEQSLKNK